MQIVGYSNGYAIVRGFGGFLLAEAGGVDWGRVILDDAGIPIQFGSLRTAHAWCAA